MEYTCDWCDKSFEKSKQYTNHRRWCSGLLKKKIRLEKKCNKCQINKGINEFRQHFHKRINRYYPASHCKKCEVIIQMEYRKAHPKWSREHNNKYYNLWKKRLTGDKCLICNESRIIDAAHIVPRNGKNGKTRNAWWNQPWNILGLCPNHHRLFDRGILNDDEYFKIKQKVEYAKIQRDNARDIQY